jgi:hypothetical protein
MLERWRHEFLMDDRKKRVKLYDFLRYIPRKIFPMRMRKTMTSSIMLGVSLLFALLIVVNHASSAHAFAPSLIRHPAARDYFVH